MNIDRLSGGIGARIGRCALLLATSMLLTACDETDSTTGPGNPTLVQIAGTITDAGTGLPISDVEVNLRQVVILGVAPRLRTTVTDSHGRYSISHHEERCAELFFIEAWKSGYSPATAGSYVDDRPDILCVETVQIYDFVLEPQPID